MVEGSDEERAVIERYRNEWIALLQANERSVRANALSLFHSLAQKLGKYLSSPFSPSSLSPLSPLLFFIIASMFSCILLPRRRLGPYLKAFLPPWVCVLSFDTHRDVMTLAKTAFISVFPETKHFDVPRFLLLTIVSTFLASSF